MDAQEYISSGAIEACIMGLADEADWLELEQMMSVYPEVRTAKELLEKEQKARHLKAAIPPPAGLKQLLQNKIFTPDSKAETPVVQIAEEPTAAKPKVVPIVPTPKSVKWLQRAVAASVILLMTSIILNFYFYSKSVTYRKENTALIAQQSSLVAKNEAMQTSFDLMKGDSMKMVKMNAVPGKDGSVATVYWDMHSKDVYLMVNNLPKHTQDKQYQLWAIVDGKPVDAGMVSENESTDSILIKMHNIPNAQAFAITLEKKGGSPTPTMEAMYVMGEV